MGKPLVVYIVCKLHVSAFKDCKAALISATNGVMEACREIRMVYVGPLCYVMLRYVMW